MSGITAQERVEAIGQTDGQMTASRSIPESGAAPRPTSSVSEYMMMGGNAEAACDGGVARLVATRSSTMYAWEKVRKDKEQGGRELIARHHPLQAFPMLNHRRMRVASAGWLAGRLD